MREVRAGEGSTPGPNINPRTSILAEVMSQVTAVMIAAIN